MIKRPSKEDSEREVLRMQREYLAEKRKNKELQPAAKVVRLNKDGTESTGKFIETYKINKITSK